MRAPRITWRRRAAAYTDPIAHALVAIAVVAPLAPRFGRGPLLTAAAAGVAIDLDHPVAARSLRLAPMISMADRPRTHNLLTALGAGAVGTAAAGWTHGWAAFAGLASHLLYDASDSAAPTPLLWPWRSPGQVGRARALAGLAVLGLASLALSRVGSGGPGRAARPAGGGDGAALPRTA